MKFYRRISYTKPYQFGKIHCDDGRDDNTLQIVNSVKKSVETHPERWEPATLEEYIEQEGGWYIRGGTDFRNYIKSSPYNHFIDGGQRRYYYYSATFSETDYGYRWHFCEEGDLNTIKGAEVTVQQLDKLLNFKEKEMNTIIVKITPATATALQAFAINRGYSWPQSGRVIKKTGLNTYLVFYRSAKTITTESNPTGKIVDLEKAFDLLAEPETFRCKIFEFEAKEGEVSNSIQFGCGDHEYTIGELRRIRSTIGEIQGRITVVSLYEELGRLIHKYDKYKSK